MDRLLVIGDIHGEYDQLQEVLKKADYDQKQDQLILVGDYIDRGNQSRKVVKSVRELVENGAIALKGNHEDMAYNYARKLETGQDVQDNLYFYNGGKKTLNCYSNTDKFIEDAKWLYQLPNKHVIEGEYIFVHAGLKPGIDLSEQR